MTERMTLSGRVDRIDERDGELVVVDYKTGRVPSTDDEARGSPALAAYVLGVRRSTGRSYHWVSTWCIAVPTVWWANRGPR